MTVYIDKDFKCHATQAEGMSAVESEYFNGKCAALVECYRYVPAGDVWVRQDGEVFAGEMIAPHTDVTSAMAMQSVYEEMTESAGDYVAAYEEGVQSA